MRQATLNRKGGRTSAKLLVGEFLKLDILVENMGRINYGPQLRDRKGILGNVTLGGEILTDWEMFRINLNGFVKNFLSWRPFERKKETKSIGEDKVVRYIVGHQTPTFYEGVIPVTPDGIPKDTFLRLKGWSKVT